MDKFEEWFASQNFYANMRFIHGDGLFIKDGEVYRVLPVQMSWKSWQSRQAELDQLNDVLDERTKEWLEAIELGTYFENVAKPLKDELDEKDKRIKQALMMIDHIQKVGLISSRYMVEDVQKALKGNDQYTEHRSKAEQQINKGARLTKHQIDLGDNNANS